MNRNKIDQPHPTPNPDGPHTQGSEADLALAALREAAGRLSRDSGTDEIPLSFLKQGLVPDPFLESDPLSEAVAASDQESQHAAAAVEAIVSRSSESFQTADSRSVDVTHGQLALDSPLAGLVVESPDPERIPAAPPTPAAKAVPPKSTDPLARPEVESQLDDDVKFPWTTLGLLAYSTALTMLLTWLIVTGRLGGSRSAMTSDDSQPAAVEPITLEAETHQPRSQPPPLPQENTVELGGVIRLGDLEAKPLEIKADQVSLVRSIDSDESRREGLQSLILRIRFTNRSPDVAFAPLHRSFVRDQQSSRWDRSEITTSDGKRFPMFPLAIDSEWMIDGQSFRSLGPGESAETVVACKPGILEDLGEDSTWRLRVRTGLYRSDMLGIRFRRDQVVRRADRGE